MKHEIIYKDVPRETFRLTNNLYDEFRGPLETYIDQLHWWNQRLNLISRDVPRETTQEHIRHSLLLHGFKVFQAADFVVDAGTGGGLPGLPLAITHSKKKFLLNDIVSKKVLSVKQIIRKLQLQNVGTSNKSIAEVEINQPFLMVSKHAFKINDLIRFVEKLPWTEIILYKGMNFEHELTGVNPSLTITAYDLSDIGSFYNDKAIVVINR